jgi:hypothetical protein
MRQKFGPVKQPAKRLVGNIRCAARRPFSAEEKWHCGRRTGLDQATAALPPKLLSDNGASCIASDLATWLDNAGKEATRAVPPPKTRQSDNPVRGFPSSRLQKRTNE